MLHTVKAENESGVPADTMRQVVVVAPLSRDVQMADLCPVANSTFRMQEMEKLRVTDVKELSSLVPNLHIPDYGSRMTSSVYIRGLGSRIEIELIAHHGELFADRCSKLLEVAQLCILVG